MIMVVSGIWRPILLLMEMTLVYLVLIFGYLMKSPCGGSH